MAVGKFSSEEEAIQLANDTSYGLGSGLHSNDANQCIRVSGALEAGTVWINQYNLLCNNVPFGGNKQSGIGMSKLTTIALLVLMTCRIIQDANLEVTPWTNIHLSNLCTGISEKSLTGLCKRAVKRAPTQCTLHIMDKKLMSWYQHTKICGEITILLRLSQYPGCNLLSTLKTMGHLQKLWARCHGLNLGKKAAIQGRLAGEHLYIV